MLSSVHEREVDQRFRCRKVDTAVVLQQYAIVLVQAKDKNAMMRRDSGLEEAFSAAGPETI